jgi:hypothetical protein
MDTMPPGAAAAPDGFLPLGGGWLFTGEAASIWLSLDPGIRAEGGPANGSHG